MQHGPHTVDYLDSQSRKDPDSAMIQGCHPVRIAG